MGDRPIIGVIGGMGPHAGIMLCQRILEETDATRDQDHVRMVLLSYPDIPDRSHYLNGLSHEDPVPGISDVVLQLGRMGAAVAGISCNTAHAPAIWDRVAREAADKVPGMRLLHLVNTTGTYIAENIPDARRVGILGTLGTYRSGIYETALARSGLIPLLPEPAIRSRFVDRAIYDPELGIKARSNPVTDEARQWLVTAIDHLQERGADCVVLGCTELPIALDDGVPGARLVDPMRAMARTMIELTYPERLREQTEIS